MLITVEKLKLVHCKLEILNQDLDVKAVCLQLVETELLRRSGAGRPKSSELTRKEQNQRAQRRSRQRKQIRKLLDERDAKRYQKCNKPGD